MVMALRHALSIALLPFTVAVIIPILIARRYGVTLQLGESVASVGLQLIGLGLLGVGVVLFIGSLRRFQTEGHGTLAPWDPPRQLVVRGLYRYVRNPMISGVIFVLCGEAALLLSWPQAIWAACFLGINLIFIPLLEEPQLQRRFGDSYAEYCRHVPRFVPRSRPWAGSGE